MFQIFKQVSSHKKKKKTPESSRLCKTGVSITSTTVQVNQPELSDYNQFLISCWLLHINLRSRTEWVSFDFGLHYWSVSKKQKSWRLRCVKTKMKIQTEGEVVVVKNRTWSNQVKRFFFSLIGEVCSVHSCCYYIMHRTHSLRITVHADAQQ